MSQRKREACLPLQGETLVTRRYIRLRPTKLSLVMLALSAAVWVGAANYQVNVAYAVCFWVIGFIGVSALLTQRQLMGLNVQAACTGEVFAGGTAKAHIRFSAHTRQSRLLWWHDEGAHLPKQPAPAEPQWHEVTLSQENQWQAQNVWEIPVTQRGYFPQPLHITVSTSAPFGLFCAECRLLWPSENIAFAAPLEHSHWGGDLAAASDEPAQHAGMHGEDIAYLNPHQAGNSLQHVAWKTYAKRGELMDKVFDEPLHRHQDETISYKDYPPGTPKDTLAGLMTHRVLLAERHQHRYTLELPGSTIPPQNGMREKCLTALALM